MFLFDEIRALHSDEKALRQFGVSMGVVFAVIAALLLWQARASFAYFLVCSLLLFIAGYAYRPPLKPLYYVWMTMAIILGWVMTRVLLGLVFYLVMTPTSVVLKLMGKHILDIGAAGDAPSYWKRRQRSMPDKKRYERQF